MLRNRIYYRLKPFIPQTLRTKVRRGLALRLRGRVGGVWPIMPGSERPPENWQGWPGGKKFALVLTHDVEGRRGLSRCRQLMQLELERGVRSAFNFVPEGDYRVSSELRNELASNGFEVGIHDLRHDGHLFVSRREFNQRAARINQYVHDWGVAGFRAAFMLHKLDWLHELNVAYDMSTFDTDPFEPQPEGRHTIFPFWVENPAASNGESNASSRPGYVELPYTIAQDSTLFVLLRERTIDIWKRKVDWIAEHGGMVLLDSHPDYMLFDEANGTKSEYPVRLYGQLLDYIQSRYSGDYWPALPREVASYIEQNRVERGVVLDRRDTRLTPSLLPSPEGSVMTLNGRAPTERFAGRDFAQSPKRSALRGKRGAVLLFSHYPADPRPRRAAEALVAEGVGIDLFCLQENRAQPRHEVVHGVNIRRIPIKRVRGGKVNYISQYSAFILACFVHLARTRKYDFIHVHNMPDVLVFSALIPKMFGAKIVLDLHDPMPELMQTIFKLSEESFSVRMLKQMEKRSVAFADSVLTVNRACKKIYSSRSCAPEKIQVILNTPDEEVFRFQSAVPGGNGVVASSPFTILYHGSLVRRNGFDLAVDALEINKKEIPNAKLMVCGATTPFFEDVMVSAAKRGLDKSIEYVGARNLHQIVEAIRQSDLGIIPNHRNIFTEINTPTRIFEYLALGKPVIAPRAPGIQDYFGDDDLFYFELGNVNDLAEKIRYVLLHPEEAQETVRRGQQIYLAHRWSREKESLLNTIAELF